MRLQAIACACLLLAWTASASGATSPLPEDSVYHLNASLTDSPG